MLEGEPLNDVISGLGFIVIVRGLVVAVKLYESVTVKMVRYFPVAEGIQVSAAPLVVVHPGGRPE
jgi:hypothetical protein